MTWASLLVQQLSSRLVTREKGISPHNFFDLERKPVMQAHLIIEIAHFRGAVPPTVTQQMSPLGEAHLKIEIAYFRGAVPPTVTQRMSPLGEAQWKIEIAYSRGAVPPTVTE